MTNKLKAFGLVLAAVLVMNALIASAAGAAEFHSSSESVNLTGSQVGNHVFTAGAGFGSVKCTSVSLNGFKFTKTEFDQTFSPTYGICTDSFGRLVDVNVGTTGYRFTAALPTLGGSVHLVHGSITLRVTAGGGLGECVVTIGEQTNNGIEYHNKEEGGVKYIEITTNTTNIVSTTSGGIFNCGVSNGTHTGGSYMGVTALKGTAGGVPTSIWVG